MIRQLRDLGFWALCLIALLLVIFPSVSIVVSLVEQAWPVPGWHLFTAGTPDDGLQNAILGTLVLCGGILVVTAPVGIAGGIYLAEFSHLRQGSWIRLGYETLAGIPSIVVGFVGYVVLDIELHWGFSLLAGILALSAIVLPYVVKTTEVALLQVPSALRDGAVALGLSRLTALRRAVLPPAIPAIISGLVVAVAIGVGETAPLLYTIGFSDQNPSLQPFQHSMGYLTYVVFYWISLPSKADHELGGAAGLILIGMLLLLIALGRLVSRWSARYSASMLS
ncbi:MAG TPA: ABC transporter permease subunit [Candidatus Dormibacteraeota bacterium]|nr:ABC transporter permease subunit [Candidatus Dormibacteraeota bacterium]